MFELLIVAVAVFVIYKFFSRKKNSVSISKSSYSNTSESAAEREYHSTKDARMSRLKDIHREIDAITSRSYSHSSRDNAVKLSREASEIVRAMNKITTGSEQEPFKDMSRQISSLINQFQP